MSVLLSLLTVSPHQLLVVLHLATPGLRTGPPAHEVDPVVDLIENPSVLLVRDLMQRWVASFFEDLLGQYEQVDIVCHLDEIVSSKVMLGVLGNLVKKYYRQFYGQVTWG